MENLSIKNGNKELYLEIALANNNTAKLIYKNKAVIKELGIITDTKLWDIAIEELFTIE